MRAVLTKPRLAQNTASKERLATIGASKSSKTKKANYIEQKQRKKQPCKNCLLPAKRCSKVSPMDYNGHAEPTAKEGDKEHSPSVAVISPSVDEGGF